MNKNIKIIFFGTPDFVIQVAESLDQNFNLVAIVTRNNSSVFKSFENKKPIFTPEKLTDEFITEIKKLEPDLFIVAAYGKILPLELLDLPKFGALNIHPSLLPKFRGPSPIQATIIAGDKISGVSIIKMDSEMDHGNIVIQEQISLSDQDNFDTLSKSMFQVGAALLVRIIPDYIEAKLPLQAQNDDEATFCKMIQKETGYFPIDTPPSPEILDRMIRAYYPWPGVWTKWNEKIVKFLPKSHVITSTAKQSSPELEIAAGPSDPRNDGGWLVQMEGKKATPFKDFLNGYPTFPIKL